MHQTPLQPRWAVRDRVRPPRGSSNQRWLWLGLFALLLHLPALQLISLLQGTPDTVQIVAMSPLPNGTLNLLGEGELQAVVVVNGDEDIALNPLGARLLKVREDGVREVIGLATIDPEDSRRLMFSVPRERGEYQIWLDADGIEPLVGAGVSLDGELVAGRLPTGDGEPGGDFVAAFRVDEVVPVPEKLVATITEEAPEPEAMQKLGDPTEDPTPRAVAKLESPVVEPTPTRERPAPRNEAPKPTIVDPTPPVRVADELPMRATRKTQPADAQIPDLFSEQAGDFEAILGEAADQTAADLKAQRKKEGLLGGWEEEWARTKGTLYGDGPKIRPGNQAAVSTHRKEVFQYIAMMHKIIHRDWAANYLINLDLLTRDPTNPLNNPNLNTVLEIELDEQGKVSDVQMVNSSGVTTYDSEAIRIAWEAGPKDPVPGSMLSPNGHAYLHWTFWRDQRQCGTFGVSVYVMDEQGRRLDVDIDRDQLEVEENRIGVRNPGATGDAGNGFPPFMADPDDHTGHEHTGAGDHTPTGTEPKGQDPDKKTGVDGKPPVKRTPGKKKPQKRNRGLE